MCIRDSAMSARFEPCWNAFGGSSRLIRRASSLSSTWRFPQTSVYACVINARIVAVLSIFGKHWRPMIETASLESWNGQGGGSRSFDVVRMCIASFSTAQSCLATRAPSGYTCIPDTRISTAPGRWLLSWQQQRLCWAGSLASTCRLIFTTTPTIHCSPCPGLTGG